jgi:hypothetical protein
MALKIDKTVQEILHVLKTYTKKKKPYRKSRYGITDAEFDQLLILQGGKCKICGTSNFPYKGPHVDHDHSTKKVRGLLCLNCNRGIGAFKEDPTLLKKALDYLLS